jgi:hypothetical protein
VVWHCAAVQPRRGGQALRISAPVPVLIRGGR